MLTVERSFLHDGSITFDFTLLTENEEPFQFYIDNVLVKTWNHTTMQGSTIHKSNVRCAVHVVVWRGRVREGEREGERSDSGCVRNRMGYHVFKWTFSPFRKGEKVRQAVIHSVAFRGLGNSKLDCDVRHLSSAYPAYMSTLS